jgi:uncharacterized protein
MLLVQTQIGVSSIHGIGLFAAQFIPKGTVTWQYHPDFDTAYTERDILNLPEAAKQRFFHYAYYDQDLEVYILCSDDQRFINHSTEQVNILSTPKQDVAARDILPGEELLCNYNCYDDTYFSRVGLSHLCEPGLTLKQPVTRIAASSEPSRISA